MKFGKIRTHEFFKNAQIALVLWTCAILYVFEKLTHASFSQIALKTILLPILITLGNTRGRQKIDKWGANIHIFVFKNLENNGFQKKLIRQNVNI